MIDQEPLTTTIAGCRDVLRHQPVSEVKIIPEFLPRQLCAVKAVGYLAKTCAIPRFPMEAVPLLASCESLSSIQIRHIHMLSFSSRVRTCPVYACPMAYLFEDGTS